MLELPGMPACNRNCSCNYATIHSKCQLVSLTARTDVNKQSDKYTVRSHHTTSILHFSDSAWVSHSACDEITCTWHPGHCSVLYCNKLKLRSSSFASLSHSVYIPAASSHSDIPKQSLLFQCRPGLTLQVLAAACISTKSLSPSFLLYKACSAVLGGDSCSIRQAHRLLLHCKWTVI